MVENKSIYNLSRQDLLTVLEGFIEHTKKINGDDTKYTGRYNDIANGILLTKYKKPKNLVIAYFLAPFASDTLFSWLFALLGDYALIKLLFNPINLIIDLSRGLGLSRIPSIIDDLGQLLPFVFLGIIGYFMGRKNYKEHWFEKTMKKGTYNNEIDAAVNSDPQYIDYKNKFTSLMNDATYQQYRSLLPQEFRSRALFNIIEIYQMLLDHRADNFEEAVNALHQKQHDEEVRKAKEEHDRYVKEQHDIEVQKAKREAKREAELAKREALISKLESGSTYNHADRFARERRKAAEKRRDKAIEDIADELKSIRDRL